MPQTKPIITLFSVLNPAALSSTVAAFALGRSNPPYTILFPLVATAGTVTIEGVYTDTIGIGDPFQTLAGKLFLGATATEWASLGALAVTANKVLAVIEYPLVGIRISVSGLSATGTYNAVLIFDE